MHLLPHSLAFLLFSITSERAQAAPGPTTSTPRAVPLVRRLRLQRNSTDTLAWLKNQRESLKVKYTGGPSQGQQKRASGTNLCVSLCHISRLRPQC